MESRISGSTTMCCLLGHPVAHSVSPKMHNEAFRCLGLDYAYLAFDILPEQLGDILPAFRAMKVRGFNLTMPLKTAIIPYLDDLSAASRLSHSVNTVVIDDDGSMHGHTTDGIGYMDSLRDRGIDIIGKKMTLLGAGGAATAIATQAALDGLDEIFILKRKNATIAQTEDFANRLTGDTSCKVTVCDMADPDLMQDCIRQSAILTNATNVGMGEDDRSLVPERFLHPGLIVSDIIYHPEVTPLLAEARDAGLTYINGKDMLLFQGAASFRLWTGHEMPVPHIKETVFS